MATIRTESRPEGAVMSSIEINVYLIKPIYIYIDHPNTHIVLTFLVLTQFLSHPSLHCDTVCLYDVASNCKSKVLLFHMTPMVETPGTGTHCKQLGRDSHASVGKTEKSHNQINASISCM